MIKKIIACADVHIKNYKQMDEYQEMLSKFIEECEEIVSKEESPEDVRIVIAGDIFHNYIDISGEGYIMASWFLDKLDKIAPVVIIAGNHDLNVKDVTRLDPLSAIVTMKKYQHVSYLDKMGGFVSACFVDDNIVWCLYSIFDKFAKPNIDEMRIEYPGKTYIGLFHGDVKGAITEVHYASEHGFEASYFEGIDFGILGHIHKRQQLSHNGIPIVYCGSMIQQNQGENISGHGYILVDVETLKYEPIDIKNENYGFYTFSIKEIEDLDNNLEEIINL